MVRKQLYITPEQDRRLKELAQKLRISEAEVVRYALDREVEEEAAEDARKERARRELSEFYDRIAEMAKTTPQRKRDWTREDAYADLYAKFND
jgi:hypothetical protein